MLRAKDGMSEDQVNQITKRGNVGGLVVGGELADGRKHIGNVGQAACWSSSRVARTSKSATSPLSTGWN